MFVSGLFVFKFILMIFVTVSECSKFNYDSFPTENVLRKVDKLTNNNKKVGRQYFNTDRKRRAYNLKDDMMRTLTDRFKAPLEILTLTADTELSSYFVSDSSVDSGRSKQHGENSFEISNNVFPRQNILGSDFIQTGRHYTSTLRGKQFKDAESKIFEERLEPVGKDPGLSSFEKNKSEVFHNFKRVDMISPMHKDEDLPPKLSFKSRKIPKNLIKVSAKFKTKPQNPLFKSMNNCCDEPGRRWRLKNAIKKHFNKSRPAGIGNLERRSNLGRPETSLAPGKTRHPITYSKTISTDLLSNRGSDKSKFKIDENNHHEIVQSKTQFDSNSLSKDLKIIKDTNEKKPIFFVDLKIYIQSNNGTNEWINLTNEKKVLNGHFLKRVPRGLTSEETHAYSLINDNSTDLIEKGSKLCNDCKELSLKGREDDSKSQHNFSISDRIVQHENISSTDRLNLKETVYTTAANILYEEFDYKNESNNVITTVKMPQYNEMYHHYYKEKFEDVAEELETTLGYLDGSIWDSSTFETTNQVIITTPQSEATTLYESLILKEVRVSPKDDIDTRHMLPSVDKNHLEYNKELQLFTIDHKSLDISSTINQFRTEASKLNNSSDEILPTVTDPLPWRQTFYITCLLISIPFLAVTLLVYWILPQLSRSDHGKATMAYLFSLTVGYSSLTITLVYGQSLGFMCYVFGYVLHFCILSISSWLNVMCFDIFWAFSVLEKKNEFGSSKLKAYSLYGWCLPGGIVALTLVLSSLPFQNKYLPDLGGDLCFYQSERTQWLYCHGPMSILMLENVIMFVATGLIIHRHSEQTKVLSSQDSARTKIQKRWFRVYCKLFFVTGMNWIAELLSLILDAGNATIIFIVTDTCNVLLGVIVFIILICHRRVLVGLKRWWNDEDVLTTRRRSTLASTLTRLRQSLINLKFSHKAPPCPTNVELKQTNDPIRS